MTDQQQDAHKLIAQRREKLAQTRETLAKTPLERPWDMAYAQWRHAEALLVGGASNAHTEAAGLLRRASSTATEASTAPRRGSSTKVATSGPSTALKRSGRWTDLLV